VSDEQVQHGGGNYCRENDVTVTPCIAASIVLSIGVAALSCLCGDICSRCVAQYLYCSSIEGYA